MGRPRSHKMPKGTFQTYHVISRCTRRLAFLDDGRLHRRDWILAEIAKQLEVFAIELHAYAIMSDHMHLVLRARPDWTENLSELQLAKLAVQYRRVRSGEEDYLALPDKVTLQEQIEDGELLEDYKAKRHDISYFMQYLKQRVSLLANREDGSRGAFWEARYYCVPLLDWSAVLGCIAYVDLNPWRAGTATSLQDCRYSSLAQHMGHEPAVPDRVLQGRLTPLDHCAPYDEQTQKFKKTVCSSEDFTAMVQVAAGNNMGEAEGKRAHQVLRSNGFDPRAWAERMPLAGLFQYGAVGTDASRSLRAETLGKKWYRDSTKLWLAEDAAAE